MTHISQGKTLILKAMINKLPSTSQQQNNAQKHQLKYTFTITSPLFKQQQLYIIHNCPYCF